MHNGVQKSKVSIAQAYLPWAFPQAYGHPVVLVKRFHRIISWLYYFLSETNTRREAKQLVRQSQFLHSRQFYQSTFWEIILRKENIFPALLNYNPALGEVTGASHRETNINAPQLHWFLLQSNCSCYNMFKLIIIITEWSPGEGPNTFFTGQNKMQ